MTPENQSLFYNLTQILGKSEVFFLEHELGRWKKVSPIDGDIVAVCTKNEIWRGKLTESKF